MPEIQTPSVRVIAFNARNAGVIPTVNITTTKKVEHKQAAQLTAAQAVTQTHKTVMDSGGTVAGLRTICIPGYSAPN